ncbi:hypothetical protein HCN44_001624 [Aphidius gifuensis]|uniref:Uncharacterized protein n=1 Tax=Aphidius gifuensis TaxID=684658 RepID=A0A835CQZ3_APHGI|nr:uncharacterized protein LOC122853200 [Aphidius gifuensis]KAF7992299.1 hypothetical protein HCN44_001624 [Aphidius gifuensis]
MLAITAAALLLDECEEHERYLEKEHQKNELRLRNSPHAEESSPQSYPDVDNTENLFERREEFQDNLRDIVVNGKSFNNLHTIYSTLINQYPDIELTYPFERAVELMKNWEHGEFLEVPLSLKEYTRILLSETWKNVLTKWNEVEMSVHTVESFDGNCITVFADHSYLQLFIDSTDFKLDVCPLDDTNVPKVEKLMNISVLVSNEWWPIAWVLIEKSTVETYTAVFHVLNSVHGVMNKPDKIVLSYFETQLGDSINLYFPSSTVICTMSVADELDRIHGKKYTSIMLIKTPRISRCFKKLLELDQLPADEIESSFERLFESSKMFDNEFLKIAFNCYRELWIEKITPKRISCFENRNIKLAKIAKIFESIDLPDVAKWTTVFRPFKIWKFTERLLVIMIILRSKIHLSID